MRHPNVVPIYGVDRHDGRLGFWSDFVKGQTLTEVVTTQGSMGPREAALIGVDVCRAAGAVHAAGFLHRDIKAGNVMREDGGRILLMDFGLTQEHGTGKDASGTPAYMAPELMLGQPATISSDVYAIGIMLFYLLTKQYPVEGADFAELRATHLSGKRRTLLDARPDLPEALAGVVETAISASPGERFPSTGRMIAALSEAIGLGAPAALVAATAKPRGLRSWLLASAVISAALRWSFSSGEPFHHVPTRRPQRPVSRRAIGARTIFWRTTTGRTRSKRRFRCSRRSPRRTRSSRPRSRTWGAPISCSSSSSATRSISNPPAKPRCARSPSRRIWRRRTSRSAFCTPSPISRTSPATSSKVRCASTNSTPRRTARWRSYRPGKDAPNWSRRRCRKPSASRPTTGA